MHRAVLTLLVGLMLSLVGTNGAFAKGDVIWEGTQEPKYSLFGKKIKKIIITTKGVFIDGHFTQASKLPLEQACLYGMANFPKNKWHSLSVVRDKLSYSWLKALSSLNAFSGVSKQTCDEIKSRAKYDFIFKSKKKLNKQTGKTANLRVAQHNQAHLSRLMILLFVYQLRGWMALVTGDGR